MDKQPIRLAWLNYAHSQHTGYAYNSSTIIENGEGQIAGTIGEMAFLRWLEDLNIDFEYCAKTSYDYDFIVNGYRIDVKTKKSKGAPRDYYTVRIPEAQKRQKCDLYVFIYITDHDAYFLGYAEKSEYWDVIGFPVKKGEKTDNFIEKVDAQVAYIRDLVDMDRLDIVLSDF